MQAKTWRGGWQGWLSKQRYAILTGTLVLRMMTVPLVESIEDGGWLPAVLAVKALQGALVIFACILAVGRGRTLAALGISVLAAGVLGGVEAIWHGEDVVEGGRAVCVCALIIWAITQLMPRAFAARVVVSANLHASAAIYLLLGFAFAAIYDLVHVIQPSAFSLSGGGAFRADTFLYYSFITLTTVGYGDVLPVSGLARMLAVTEALAGQIYLVVNVSRLVGLHVAHHTSDHGKG